jgi:hypothetical protein
MLGCTPWSAMVGQQSEVVGASVLDAAIGVMNQARRRLPFGQGHAQSHENVLPAESTWGWRSRNEL